MKWKELAERLEKGKTLDAELQQQLKNEAKKWREWLRRIFDVILFLAKQNLPLRGHWEDWKDENSEEQNCGNFLELLRFLGKYDPFINDMLVDLKTSQKRSISYTSAKIQNEMIDLLGSKVRAEILKEVKQEAKYYAMIFDSTPDIAHHDQLSQVLRYVTIEGQEVIIKERFIDFIHMEGRKTAEVLTDTILEKLAKDGLPVADCRAQVYDNASVMAGESCSCSFFMIFFKTDSQVMSAKTNHLLHESVNPFNF